MDPSSSTDVAGRVHDRQNSSYRQRPMGVVMMIMDCYRARVELSPNRTELVGDNYHYRRTSSNLDVRAALARIRRSM